MATTISRTSALAVALAIGVAGCRGDGPAPDPDADAERVGAALVTVDDLPDGFESEPVDDADEREAERACFEEELGITETEADAAPTARSDPVQFENETMSLRARITAFANADMPRDVIDALDGAEVLQCLDKEYRAALEGEDIELETIEAIDPFGGDDSEAYRLRFQFTAAGIAVESQFAELLVDRFVVSVQASGRRGDVDEAVLADALETMADRLEDEG